MADVRLTDLAVIKRFSLAVRGEYADAADVAAALEDDLARVRALVGDVPASAKTSAKSPKKKTAPVKKTAEKAAAKKKAAKKKAAPVKKTAKKTAKTSR